MGSLSDRIQEAAAMRGGVRFNLVRSLVLETRKLAAATSEAEALFRELEAEPPAKMKAVSLKRQIKDMKAMLARMEGQLSLLL